MRYSASRRMSTPGALLVALVLVAPPVAQLVLRQTRPPATAATPAGASPETALDELRAANARLAGELAAARRLIGRLEGWSLSPAAMDTRAAESGDGDAERFRPLDARVLPIHDPAPRRHAVWVRVAGDTAPSIGAPAVADGKLVGRVERVLPGNVAACILTVRDPRFTVRFRIGETWGFLRGTGEADADGRPVLAVEHASTDTPLAPGALLVSDGEDGVFPAGLVLGEILEDARRGAAGGQLVRAAVAIDDLREIFVLDDRAVRSVRDAIEEEGS